MDLSVLNVLWQIAGHFLQPYAELLPRLLWGGVAVCYLVLLVLPAKGPVGRVFSKMFLVALLCLHVAGIYVLMATGVSLEWILALLLASAVVGTSLGDLRGGGGYAVMLCLHVAGIYVLMATGVSLEWILALLLASAVVGTSLGDLRGGGGYAVMLCLCAVAVCLLFLAKVSLWVPILAAALTVLVCVFARCRKGGRDR